MEALQRMGLRYKISLNLRSGVKIRSLENSQKLVVIGSLTLYLRREKVQIHQRRRELVECDVKSSMVSSLRGRIIDLVVATVVTK